MNTVYSIGHSARSSDEFVDLLRSYGIQQLIDIRTIPRSRHNPQFDMKGFAAFLRRRKINYSHAKSLGGLRRPKKDSINLGWRNESFRGYADYMLSEAFGIALDGLILKARRKRTVIMCAEAVPWRCHRSLIADALVVKEWRVLHILSKTSLQEHKLTPFAKIEEGRLVYPEEQS